MVERILTPGSDFAAIAGGLMFLPFPRYTGARAYASRVSTVLRE